MVWFEDRQHGRFLPGQRDLVVDLVLIVVAQFLGAGDGGDAFLEIERGQLFADFLGVGLGTQFFLAFLQLLEGQLVQRQLLIELHGRVLIPLQSPLNRPRLLRSGHPREAAAHESLAWGHSHIRRRSIGPARYLVSLAAEAAAIDRRPQRCEQFRLHGRPGNVQWIVEVHLEADRPTGNEGHFHVVPVVVAGVFNDGPALDVNLAVLLQADAIAGLPDRMLDDVADTHGPFADAGEAQADASSSAYRGTRPGRAGLAGIRFPGRD